MHTLLEKLFQKRGIEDVNQLDKEEKQVFEEWNLVLNKEELSTEDIKKFLQAQIEAIEGKWADITSLNKADLIPYHTCYKLLLGAISSPRSAREAMEKQLINLLKQ